MVEELGYEEAINEVSAIEASALPNRVVVLKVKEALSERVAIRTYGQKDALRTIELAGSIVPYNAADEVKPVKQEKRSHGLGLGGLFGGRSRRPVTAEKEFKPGENVQMMAKGSRAVGSTTVQLQPSTQPSYMRVPSAGGMGTMEHDAGNAGKELRSILSGRIGSRNATQDISANAEDMIMPSLAVPDQIAELERIELGLDGNVFNNEQLKLIRMEIQSLKANMKGEKSAQGEVGSLLSVRDQKLRSVETKLAGESR